MDQIIALRDGLKQPEQVDRELPDVSKEYIAGLQAAAKRINALPDFKRVGTLAVVLYENTRLLAEVNALRSMLGFPLLPVYDPGKMFKHG